MVAAGKALRHPSLPDLHGFEGWQDEVILVNKRECVRTILWLTLRVSKFDLYCHAFGDQIDDIGSRELQRCRRRDALAPQESLHMLPPTIEGEVRAPENYPRGDNGRRRPASRHPSRKCRRFRLHYHRRARRGTRVYAGWWDQQFGADC